MEPLVSLAMLVSCTSGSILGSDLDNLYAEKIPAKSATKMPTTNTKSRVLFLVLFMSGAECQLLCHCNGMPNLTDFGIITHDLCQKMDISVHVAGQIRTLSEHYFSY